MRRYFDNGDLRPPAREKKYPTFGSDPPLLTIEAGNRRRFEMGTRNDKSQKGPPASDASPTKGRHVDSLVGRAMFGGESAAEAAAAFSAGSPAGAKRKPTWNDEDADEKPPADLQTAQKPRKKGSKPGGFPASKKETEALVKVITFTTPNGETAGQPAGLANCAKTTSKQYQQEIKDLGCKLSA